MRSINSKDWRSALLSATNAMHNHVAKIDAMNVFPVPDGDTGTNMFSTIQYAWDQIKNSKSENISELTSGFARGALLGCRGNSGVILSQIFKGFLVALKDKKEIEVVDLILAFKHAKEYAYASVMKPVEGTILTVIRLISEKLNSLNPIPSQIEDILNVIMVEARKACDLTPTMLPILKEVGVNDSGGEGLFVILDGFVKGIQGSPVESKDKQIDITNNEWVSASENFNGEFGYCTEFIVQLKNYKKFNKKKFHDEFSRHGNSIVIVQDEDILKCHIHTLKPGNVFNYAQNYGEFLKLKSENMDVQNSDYKNSNVEKTQSSTQPFGNDNSKIAVISCNVGVGIIKDMKDLGVTHIIEAGQSMNPSAKDFIEVIDKISAKEIIILPNNPNIIMVAQQVAQTSNKKVIVLHSKTQMQGLTAMMMFSPQATLKENKENMLDGINSVKTGMITKSIKTTKIGGVEVKKDEYLAMLDKKILKSNKVRNKAAEIVVDEALKNDDIEIVTIYYGEDVSETGANELANFIENNYDVEVETKMGGQPIYDFLISFE